ncbi:unnamed protein product [Acidocella sp. C78]|nr:unnamed protein product [Acidocella sp. C78]
MRTSSTSSNTSRAGAKAAARSRPMPTAWLPCPGKMKAFTAMFRFSCRPGDAVGMAEPALNIPQSRALTLARGRCRARASQSFVTRRRARLFRNVAETPGSRRPAPPAPKPAPDSPAAPRRSSGSPRPRIPPPDR